MTLQGILGSWTTFETDGDKFYTNRIINKKAILGDHTSVLQPNATQNAGIALATHINDVYSPDQVDGGVADSEKTIQTVVSSER